AQDQRLVRRVEIQPDDVPELLFKALVVRQLEGAREMRLDVTGRPQAAARWPARSRRRGPSCGSSIAPDGAAASPPARPPAAPPPAAAMACARTRHDRSTRPAGAAQSARLSGSPRRVRSPAVRRCAVGLDLAHSTR